MADCGIPTGAAARAILSLMFLAHSPVAAAWRSQALSSPEQSRVTPREGYSHINCLAESEGSCTSYIRTDVLCNESILQRPSPYYRGCVPWNNLTHRSSRCSLTAGWYRKSRPQAQLSYWCMQIVCVTVKAYLISLREINEGAPAGKRGLCKSVVKPVAICSPLTISFQT